MDDLIVYKKTNDLYTDVVSIIEQAQRSAYKAVDQILIIRNWLLGYRIAEEELSGEFCRGCGYCMPCTVDITINQCARMSQMIRRAPSQNWLTDHWQQEMLKIDSCVDCGLCKTRCPYELDIPNLLKKNLKDYKEILAGKPV